MDESTNEGEAQEEEEEADHPGVGEEIEKLTPERREEIKAIRRAMDEENERIGTAQSRESRSRDEDRTKWSRGRVYSFCVFFHFGLVENQLMLLRVIILLLFVLFTGAEKNQRRSSPRGKFIDFVAAKQREVSKKVASKQK